MRKPAVRDMVGDQKRSWREREELNIELCLINSPLHPNRILEFMLTLLRDPHNLGEHRES
jgi:hypothetical protein